MSWSHPQGSAGDAESGQSDSPGEASSDTWTIQRVLSWSTGFLKDKLFDTPRLDAELLLTQALGLTRVQLYTYFDKPLTQQERDSFKAYLRRRAAGEPVAYITGCKDFMDSSFDVSPAVLIPRPDTEVLVESVLAWVKDKKVHDHALRILDIGTGSGCIALSLAKRLPMAHVIAWDVASDALALARRNADKLQISSVDFVQGDALQPSLWQGVNHPFDIIVSNPPYIAETERPQLSRSVKDFEPETALFAAEDGYAFYRTFASMAGRALHAGGALFVEIGSSQAERVTQLLQAAAWTNIVVQKDYNKLDRVVIAEPPPN